MHYLPPEYHHHEEFRNRSSKLEEIRQMGIDPYPPHYSPKERAGQLETRYAKAPIGTSEEAEQGKTEETSLAGRIVLFRAMGKNAFAHIQDETGRVQLFFNRDHTRVDGLKPESGLTSIKFVEKKLDLGDIIGVKGHLFRTHTGELTLYVKELTLLAKSLLPLPDKHSGLVDKGVRYRKRWLDLLTNREATERLLLRSEIIHFIRTYFNRLHFKEVETPVLQNVYGGAEARPFTTKLFALDQEMFLRISLEIPLKKLIVGGMERIYEISKVFRNEGIDRTHNPEFTMLEAYAAYWDYHDMMALMENLYQDLALHLFGKTEITLMHENKEYTIDLKAPWKRLSMKESIRIHGAIDVDKKSDDELKQILKKSSEIAPFEIDHAPRGLLIAYLFETLVEDKLIQPHHIIDHPIETTPLCKLHRDPKLHAERFVERFESFIMGGECSNSYTELNDPQLQRQLLEQQALKKDSGNELANPLDEEFIEAICQGMPPTGGIGIGIDRLVMLFTRAASIRDVLFFPLMRPEDR